MKEIIYPDWCYRTAEDGSTIELKQEMLAYRFIDKYDCSVFTDNRLFKAFREYFFNITGFMLKVDTFTPYNLQDIECRYQNGVINAYNIEAKPSRWFSKFVIRELAACGIEPCEIMKAVISRLSEMCGEKMRIFDGDLPKGYRIEIGERFDVAYDTRYFNSCMANNNNAWEFYRLNSDKCQAVLLFKGDDLVARSILWTDVVDEDGQAIKLLDRVYGDKQNEQQYLQSYIIRKGFATHYRGIAAICSCRNYNEIFDKNGKQYDKSISTLLRWDNKIPYMDTFRWIDTDDIVESKHAYFNNHDGEKSFHQTYVIVNTCPKCGLPSYSSLSCEYCHTNLSIFNVWEADNSLRRCYEYELENRDEYVFFNGDLFHRDNKDVVKIYFPSGEFDYRHRAEYGIIRCEDEYGIRANAIVVHCQDGSNYQYAIADNARNAFPQGIWSKNDVVFVPTGEIDVNFLEWVLRFKGINRNDHLLIWSSGDWALVEDRFMRICHTDGHTGESIESFKWENSHGDDITKYFVTERIMSYCHNKWFAYDRFAVDFIANNFFN